MTLSAPYASAAVLEFDPERHEYRASGRLVPSVTQIIQDVGFMDSEHYTESARALGSAVHAAIHYLDESDLDWDTVTPELTGYVRAWEKFKLETQIEIELREYRVFNRIFGYAGTLDRTARLNWEPGTWLLDAKTGAHEDWHALQSAAYCAAFEKPLRYRRAGVYLSADGAYRIREFPPGEFTDDWSDFQAALRVWNRKRRKHGNSNSH